MEGLHNFWSGLFGAAFISLKVGRLGFSSSITRLIFCRSPCAHPHTQNQLEIQGRQQSATRSRDDLAHIRSPASTPPIFQLYNLFYTSPPVGLHSDLWGVSPLLNYFCRLQLAMANIFQQWTDSIEAYKDTDLICSMSLLTPFSASRIPFIISDLHTYANRENSSFARKFSTITSQTKTKSIQSTIN